jgi:signal transduction histidine kinase
MVYNLILENVPIYINRINRNKKIYSSTGQGLERLGFCNGEIDKRTVTNTFSHFIPYYEKALSGEFVSCDDTGETQGNKWWFKNYFFPDNTGNGVINIAFDITESMLAREEAHLRREQLLQADKMTSLGALVAGIAHEINNPNMFIGLGADNVALFLRNTIPVLDSYYKKNKDWVVGGKPYCETRDKIKDILGGIQDGSKRISKIVTSLKDFARPDTGKLNERVDINKTIGSAVDILHNMIKRSTSHFTFLPGPNLPTCKGNTQQIEQVIINLLSNACQALTDSEQAVSIITSIERDSDEIVIAVKDEGCGISRENLSRVSEPFFTTKQVVGGLGIGLSITFDIIKKHNGSIEYYSKQHKGTTVKVTLPTRIHSGKRAPAIAEVIQ